MVAEGVRGRERCCRFMYLPGQHCIKRAGSSPAEAGSRHTAAQTHLVCISGRPAQPLHQPV